MLNSCLLADGAQVNRSLLCAHHLDRRPQNRHALLGFAHALLLKFILYSCFTHALLMLYSWFTRLCSCFTHALLGFAHALLLKILFALIILIVGPKIGPLYSALLIFTHALLTHALLVLYLFFTQLYSCFTRALLCATHALLMLVCRTFCTRKETS